jgi:hypothetical protein
MVSPARSGPSPAVARSLEVLHLDYLFLTYPTLADTLAACVEPKLLPHCGRAVNSTPATLVAGAVKRRWCRVHGANRQLAATAAPHR